MTPHKKNLLARIARTLATALQTTVRPLKHSSQTPPSPKRTAAQPSVKDTADPSRLSAPGKTILCSGRFEMNDHGEILLDPGSGESPDWFFWSSGPNAMVRLDSLSVSSGVLYFAKADPNEPSHTPGVFQLSGISDPCLSLPITDILYKAMLEYLKPECLKAAAPGSPLPGPKHNTPTPKETPMNELAEIREKIELVKLEIKALERLFQIVSNRVRCVKNVPAEHDPEHAESACQRA